MAVTVTPVLSSKDGYIEDIRDQIASLIRYVIMNPGYTSSIFDNTISFRVLASIHEHDRDDFASACSRAIRNALTKMFPDYSFSTEFTTEDYTTGDSHGPDPRYSVNFNIMMASRTTQENLPGIVSGSIVVDSETYGMNVVFNKNVGD